MPKPLSTADVPLADVPLADRPQGVAGGGDSDEASPMIWLVGSLDALRADGFMVADGVLQTYLQAMATALAPSRVASQVSGVREQVGAETRQAEVVPIQAPQDMLPALSAAEPIQPLLVPCTLSLPSLAALGTLLPMGWTDALVQRCRDVAGLRAWVAEQDAGLGVLDPKGQPEPALQVGWLPLIVTARGVLYGEAIAADSQVDSGDPVALQRIPYRQPWHLNDRQRQQLYGVGRSLATELNLPWGVHLMQFREYSHSRASKSLDPTLHPSTTADGSGDRTLVFDRLYPYPGPPALASCGVQEPDLLSCHRACVLGQPLRDVVIPQARSL